MINVRSMVGKLQRGLSLFHRLSQCVRVFDIKGFISWENIPMDSGISGSF